MQWRSNEDFDQTQRHAGTGSRSGCRSSRIRGRNSIRRNMKTVLITVFAGTLLATLAVAQPSRSAAVDLAFSGDLIAIDPATGATSLFGATGLGDCSTAASPCGSNSAGFLGNRGGKLYATDFANKLYSLDPKTGAAKVIGPTGIPAYTFSPNVFYDESLFTFRGKLYANFETVTFDPGTGMPIPVTPDALYEINTDTGKATWIAPTTFGLITIATVN